MTDSGRKASSIVIVGVAPAWLAGSATMLTQPDTVSVDKLFARLNANTKVLAVGLETSADAMTRLLPSIRTAYPTLAVVAVVHDRESEQSPAVLSWVDGVFATSCSLEAFLTSLDGGRRGTEAHLEASKLMAVRAFNYIAPFVALIALWAALVALLSPPAYLLPSPQRVIYKFLEQPDRFLLHLATTAYEALVGFVIGNTLGIVFAIVLTRYLSLKRYALPVLISLQAIPVVAFAPLLGVWLGSGLISKVAMATIICFFPMVVNALQAFASVERDYLDLFEIYRSGFLVKLKRLLLPAAAPSIVAALKISAGLSVVGAIVAEMIGADRGLGYLILNGAYRLETDVLFVAMALSAVLGVSFFQFPKLISSLLPTAWTRGLQVKES